MVVENDESERNLLDVDLEEGQSLPEAVSASRVFQQQNASSSVNFGSIYIIFEIKRILETYFQDWSEIVFALFFFFAVSSFFLSFVGIAFFWGYSVTATFGLAWSRIRLLGSLKKQLDRFEQENKKLAANVESFKAQNKELKKTSDALKSNNIEYHAQNEAFKKSLDDLSEVSQLMEGYAARNQQGVDEVFGALRASLAEQRAIQARTQRLQQKNLRLARAQERALVLNLFFQVDSQDGERDGLAAEEFRDFVDLLPEALAAEAQGLDFARVDADGDGRVGFRELKAWVQSALDRLDREEAAAAAAAEEEETAVMAAVSGNDKLDGMTV